MSKIIDRVVSREIEAQRAAQRDLVRKGLAPRTSVLKGSKLDKRRFDERLPT